MRRLLLALAVVGTVNAIVYQPATLYRRLQNLANIDLKTSNFITNKINEKTNLIQRLSSRFQKLASTRSPDISRDDYVDNPLPALVLIRRLVEDWTALAWTLRDNHGFSQLGLRAMRWPSDRDLHAAALTVMRAQWTYNLDIHSLASGTASQGYGLLNVTAADCFYIARTCLKYLFVTEALEWLQQSLHKISLGDSSFPAQTLMQYFVLYKCSSGDSRISRAKLIELLKQYPNLKAKHQETDLKAYFSLSMIDLLKCSELPKKFEDQRESGWYGGIPKADLEKHRRLCRGEGKADSRLACRYVHYHQPNLRFQPFKLEELHLDPPVVRFYDAATDRETDILKTFAFKYLKPAATVYPDGSNVLSSYRTSITGWIREKALDENERLTSRMGVMAQLDHETAEQNQFSRYSISGEYLPHIDYFGEKRKPFLYDRIATMLFYLNDVKKGGHTVFTKWNVSVKPVKNTAILWFNFLPNGQADGSSQHSACPVLQGTKWVFNKLFLNIGNVFKKPCGLHPEDSFRRHYLQ